jgi:Family of unknown function (DUF6130)
MGHPANKTNIKGGIVMHTTLMYLAAMTACTALATMASAQSAKDIRGPSPLIAIENEAPPKLIVDPPLPEPLALGRVFIQYRTENMRVYRCSGKVGFRYRRASAMFTLASTTRRGTLSMPVAKRSSWLDWNRARTKCWSNSPTPPTK